MLSNTGTRRKKIGFQGDPRTSYARMGWNAAKNGEVFRYDVGGRVDQTSAYEVYRLFALTLREHGQPIPAWNADSMVPPRVATAIAKAKELIRQEYADRGVCNIPTGPRTWKAEAA